MNNNATAAGNNVAIGQGNVSAAVAPPPQDLNHNMDFDNNMVSNSHYSRSLGLTRAQFSMNNGGMNMDFANPAVHGGPDVLADFDFDSFLVHNADDNDFQFDSNFGIEGEIGVNEQ